MNRRVRGERSDTERHWDNICLGLIPIGAAAFAAVFLVVKPVAESVELDKTVTLVGLTGAAMAGLALMWLMVKVSRTILRQARVSTPLGERNRQKWRDAADAFAVLGTLGFISALTIISVTITPEDWQWKGDSSRTIRVSQGNWDRLEALAGTEGTDDDKVGRVLEMAGAPDPEDKQRPWKEYKEKREK